MKKKYTLASSKAREDVDLRDHKDIIVKAVTEVMGSHVDQVLVEKDCYYVSPSPKKGEAIRIGRLIRKSALGNYCVKIPKLFSSVEMEEENNDNSKQQQHGGHH